MPPIRVSPEIYLKTLTGEQTTDTTAPAEQYIPLSQIPYQTQQQNQKMDDKTFYVFAIICAIIILAVLIIYLKSIEKRDYQYVRPETASVV